MVERWKPGGNGGSVFQIKFLTEQTGSLNVLIGCCLTSLSCNPALSPRGIPKYHPRFQRDLDSRIWFGVLPLVCFCCFPFLSDLRKPGAGDAEYWLVQPTRRQGENQKRSLCIPVSLSPHGCQSLRPGRRAGWNVSLSCKVSQLSYFFSTQPWFFFTCYKN